MSAILIDLSTMRAVRRGARFRKMPERPAFRVALRALVTGMPPMAAYAKAASLWQCARPSPPKGAA